MLAGTWSRFPEAVNHGGVKPSLGGVAGAGRIDEGL